MIGLSPGTAHRPVSRAHPPTRRQRPHGRCLMRTLIVVLCLAFAPPALAAHKRIDRETGPNMQWYYTGPNGALPAVPGGVPPRPPYEPRSRLYLNPGGSVAA